MVFSICALLGDFLNFIKSNKIFLDSSTDIEIGFSFPNWLKDRDFASKTAVNNYHQAIILACFLFHSYRDELPLPNKPYSLNKWKELIGESNKNFSFPEESKIKISDMTTTDYNLSVFYKK